MAIDGLIPLKANGYALKYATEEARKIPCAKERGSSDQQVLKPSLRKDRMVERQNRAFDEENGSTVERFICKVELQRNPLKHFNHHRIRRGDEVRKISTANLRIESAVQYLCQRRRICYQYSVPSSSIPRCHAKADTKADIKYLARQSGLQQTFGHHGRTNAATISQSLTCVPALSSCRAQNRRPTAIVAIVKQAALAAMMLGRLSSWMCCSIQATVAGDNDILGSDHRRRNKKNT